MQQIISKEQLWEKIDRLNPSLQQTVMSFVDALLKTQTTVKEPTVKTRGLYPWRYYLMGPR